MREGWIPSIPDKNIASTDLYGSCYDIIFRTSNDDSFVHEFPDPESLDTKNWQGYEIDDDVVRSHGQSLEKDAQGKWYDPNTITIAPDHVDSVPTTPDHVDSVPTTPDHVPFVKSLSFTGGLTIMAIVSVLLCICFKRKSRRGYTELDSSDSLKVEMAI